MRSSLLLQLQTDLNRISFFSASATARGRAHKRTSAVDMIILRYGGREPLPPLYFFLDIFIIGQSGAVFSRSDLSLITKL